MVRTRTVRGLSVHTPLLLRTEHTVERAAHPTSPLVLETHELGRRPGSSRPVTRTVPAPVDFGTAVIGIPEGAPVKLDLLLEAVMEGVLVSGTATGEAVGECVRCLDRVAIPVVVDVQELFAYPERAEVSREVGDTEAEDVESILSHGELADLEPALRDSLVTALPFSPLCRPDCPGLCSECGARLADDPQHAHDVTDPRWSALQSMFDPSNVSDETKES